ncbi:MULTISPECIES: hypothetical protein [Candidatus Cardinium]|uniref:hypothetical protein n=1 Tax=Candidatus Cardinium TaxID=273135 RepID=UPI001FA9ABA5|nr:MULTISPECIES: hypothetical protein [Cardinium]
MKSIIKNILFFLPFLGSCSRLVKSNIWSVQDPSSQGKETDKNIDNERNLVLKNVCAYLTTSQWYNVAPEHLTVKHLIYAYSIFEAGFEKSGLPKGLDFKLNFLSYVIEYLVFNKNNVISESDVKAASERNLKDLVDVLSKNKNDKYITRSDFINNFIKFSQAINQSPMFLVLCQPQELSILLNELSKWDYYQDGVNACQSIVRCISQKINQENTYLNQLRQRDLVTLVHGFSKSKCREQQDTASACKSIALYISQKINQEDTYLNQFHQPDLVTLVHGFSKFREQEAIQNVCQSIALYINQQINQEGTYLNQFDSQGLANLVNGLAKLMNGCSKCKEQEAIQNVCQSIALYINQKIKENNNYLHQFNAQGLVKLVHSFSKCREQKDIQNLLRSIALCICRAIDLDNRYLEVFHPKYLVKLMNGFSKCRKQEAIQNVCYSIARHINKKIKQDNRYLQTFHPEELLAHSEWICYME